MFDDIEKSEGHLNFDVEFDKDSDLTNELPSIRIIGSLFKNRKRKDEVWLELAITPQYNITYDKDQR